MIANLRFYGLVVAATKKANEAIEFKKVLRLKIP